MFATRSVPNAPTIVLLLVALLSSLTIAIAPTAAEAATIVVTRADDPAPGTPGQCGSPAAGGSNDCSLRQAVRRANSLAGPDTVTVPAGTYTLTRLGAAEDNALTGDIDVTDDLTIIGAGQTTTTVSGAGMAATPDRLFHATIDNVSLDMTDLTLTLGESSTSGGALRNDGGTIVWTRVTATENRDTGVADAGAGGALANFGGTVIIDDSVLTDNTVEGFYGGAIFNFATDVGGPVTASVAIRDSELRGNESETGYGGAIATEAELTSTANLTIERSLVTENVARNCCGGAIIADDFEYGSGGPDARTNVVILDSQIDGNQSFDCCGAAIYAEGTGGTPEPTVTLRVEDSTINGNVDDNCCGGAAAIYAAEATFVDSEIRDNASGDTCCGGALEIGNGADVTFLRTTIADNSTSGCCGGAMDIYGGSTVRLIDSTLSGNATTGPDDAVDIDDGGGAIVIYDQTDVLEVVNSTISGNSTNSMGGGIFAYRGTVSIVHSTISGNSADIAGGALAVGATPDATADAVVTVVNSIIDGACEVGDDGVLTSGGGNVTTDNACGFTEANDQTVTDAGLDDLADNGGPTLTHALLADSPALDAGTAATPDPVTADQRGVERPQEGDGAAPARPDAGSVEMAYADLSVTKTVDNAAPTQGDQVTYTVTATNAGPDAAPVQIIDVLPDGVTFVSASSGCTHNAGTVTCDNGGSVAPGDTLSGTIIVTADDVGTITNTADAVLGSATFTDPDVSDNTDSVAITVAETPAPDPVQRALPGGVRRLAGEDRLLTAVEISKQTYADGAAGAVVLARSDDYPDALAGTPLAVQVDAPLLLTPPDGLAPATATELQRVLAAGGTVYLLGGPVALSQAVEDAVKTLGFTTTRYAGDTRFATAVKIATDALDTVETGFLVTGRNYPDAVSAGAATAATNGAILLTDGSVMPAETSAYLATLPATAPVFAIGGPAAAAQSGDTDLIGADRLATSLLVANQFFDDPPVAGIATGYNFPDALTGGAQLGAYGGPMLLSRQDILTPELTVYLQALPDDATVFLYGGPVALSEDVETAVISARTR